METVDLARVITILEEVKEEAEGLANRTRFAAAIRIHAKIVEAESILLGQPATRPEEN